MFPAFKGSPTAASAASQTAWNQDVSKAPVDPRSGAYIRRITRLGGNQVVHPDFGGDGRYGIPYNVVGRHQRRVRVHVTAYPGESDFGRAPIPPHVRVEGGSDRHVLVVQRGRCDLFEMFGAHYVGATGIAGTRLRRRKSTCTRPSCGTTTGPPPTPRDWRSRPASSGTAR